MYTINATILSADHLQLAERECELECVCVVLHTCVVCARALFSCQQVLTRMRCVFYIDYIHAYTHKLIRSYITLNTFALPAVDKTKPDLLPLQLSYTYPPNIPTHTPLRSCANAHEFNSFERMRVRVCYYVFWMWGGKELARVCILLTRDPRIHA